MHKLFAKATKIAVKKKKKPKRDKREKHEKHLSPEEQYRNCPVCKRKMERIMSNSFWPRRCEHCKLTISEPRYI